MDTFFDPVQNIQFVLAFELVFPEKQLATDVRDIFWRFFSKLHDLEFKSWFEDNFKMFFAERSILKTLFHHNYSRKHQTTINVSTYACIRLTNREKTFFINSFLPPFSSNAMIANGFWLNGNGSTKLPASKCFSNLMMLKKRVQWNRKRSTYRWFSHDAFRNKTVS